MLFFACDNKTMDIFIVTLASLLAGFVDAIVGGGGLILLPTLFAVYPATVPATLLGTNKGASIWGSLFAGWQYSRRVEISLGGVGRLCDPGLTANTGDTRACNNALTN